MREDRRSSCCQLHDGAGVGVLGVGVDVHLDDAVGHCQCDFFVGGAGAAVHDQVERTVVDAEVCCDLILDGAQDFRAELHEARLVSAVNVAEGQSGDVAALFTQA